MRKHDDQPAPKAASRKLFIEDLGLVTGAREFTRAPTTMAVGEEGGTEPTTMATGEEDGHQRY